MRVAVTLEQCWHAVPGGTAWSTLELVRALADPRRRRTRRRRAPATVIRRRRRGRPPIAGAAPAAASRTSLYETWHAPLCRWPRVERATGPVDVVHATAVAYPARSAPVVVTVHDLAFLHDPTSSPHATGTGSSGAASSWPAATPDW